MAEPVDLCRSIRGEKQGDKCAVDSSHKLFQHCKTIGGELKGGKCVISEERLKQLTS